MKKYIHPNRTVICQDALEFLRAQPDLSLPATITSLPDAEETGMEFGRWKEWFVEACELIFLKTMPGQYIFFYQTDRKTTGTLIDKSFLVNKAAYHVGIRQMWHKIALKRDVGKCDIHRPTFTHLLCYSFNLNSGKATPDVFHAGEMIYKNAMGLNAAQVCLDMIGDKSDTIFDPFCGRGSVLEIANRAGKKAIGIDIDDSQCQYSKLPGSVVEDDEPYSLED